MKNFTVHCGSFSSRFDFSPEAFEQALGGLPEVSFRKSVRRYQNPAHRWMSLLSRQLLLRGLAEANEVLPAGATWSVTSNGRPHIKACPDFNISHSGKIAICAIGTDGDRVGIDIQAEKVIGERHLRQVLTSRELAWVSGEPRRAAFLWSRKEAVSKLLGLGMRINYRRLEALNKEVQFDGKTYHLTSLPVARGYQCALAGEVPLTPTMSKYRWVSLTQLVGLNKTSIHHNN